MAVVVQSAEVEVCALEDVQPERGGRALVHGRHVAVFRTCDDEVHAIDAIDPFSGASVLSRGIVGSAGDALFVASPMYKQRFDLRTGQCLDDPAVSVRVYPAEVVDGRVVVQAA